MASQGPESGSTVGPQPYFATTHWSVVLDAGNPGSPQAAGALGKAARLGMTEVAVRVAVHRLRQRYREVLRTEVAQTLSDPSELASELQYLFSLFG